MYVDVIVDLNAFLHMYVCFCPHASRHVSLDVHEICVVCMYTVCMCGYVYVNVRWYMGLHPYMHPCIDAFLPLRGIHGCVPYIL